MHTQKDERKSISMASSANTVKVVDLDGLDSTTFAAQMSDEFCDTLKSSEFIVEHDHVAKTVKEISEEVCKQFVDKLSKICSRYGLDFQTAKASEVAARLKRAPNGTDNILMDSEDYLVPNASETAKTTSVKIDDPVVEKTHLCHEEDEDVVERRGKRKPFILRRFKGLTKGHSLNVFQKQDSDEVELSSASSDNPLQFNQEKKKAKVVKIYGEKVKEGFVHVLANEALGEDSAKLKWRKGRMMLAKTKAGYIIEIYIPPKSSRPKYGIMCLLLTEARPTTDLEIPDKTTSFVVKFEIPASNCGVENGDTDAHFVSKEIVLDAPDGEELSSWVTAISACMNCSSPQASKILAGLAKKKQRLSLSLSSSFNFLRREPVLSQSHSNLGANLSGPLGLQDLPTKLSGDLGLLNKARTGQDIGHEFYVEMIQTLSEYPWFHGSISRADASQLVLQDQTTSSNPSSPGEEDKENEKGVFLVRVSETRKSEFVLTFSSHGRAKHLRIMVNPDGRCRVQHMWFNSIFHCLDIFRENPLPLDAGGTPEIKLGPYVVKVPLDHQDSNRSQRPSSAAFGGARPRVTLSKEAPTPVERPVILHDGSVRVQTKNLTHLWNSQNGEKENAYNFS